METVTAFKANDGQVFLTKEQAKRHENQLKINEAKRLLTIACQEMLVSIEIQPTAAGCERCAEFLIENRGRFEKLLDES